MLYGVGGLKGRVAGPGWGEACSVQREMAGLSRQSSVAADPTGRGGAARHPCLLQHRPHAEAHLGVVGAERDEVRAMAGPAPPLQGLGELVLGLQTFL